jgi:Zn-dependent M28 family amino/carboxypeptidase
MLNFDMVGSPNAGWFVYDGDASDTASTGSTGSGVVEDVFVDVRRRRDSGRRPLYWR